MRLTITMEQEKKIENDINESVNNFINTITKPQEENKEEEQSQQYEEIKKPSTLEFIVYVPLLIKLIGKHWNSIVKIWGLLKPIINDVSEEIKKRSNNNAQ